MPLTRRTILALIGAAVAAPAGARSMVELGAPTPFDWDWLAFLGASYFRARGDLNQYGASARGIAIDTASERPEEFPDFRAFWIEPLNGDGQGRIFALLDGPSLTGAYRFDVSLHPQSIT